MGLMTNFQKEKTKDPNHGTEESGGYGIVATMPGVNSSSVVKQQAVLAFEKEMAADLESLKLIRSVKEKERTKAEHLVPKYLEFCTSLIDAGTPHPLLGQVLVWLFDIKDIHQAMTFGTFCIEHDVPMPERFSRDLATYLCDVIVEWAEVEHEAGRSVEPYFTDILQLSQGFDLPDQVTAKMYRLDGMIWFEAKEYETAVVSLEKAMEYGAKVKTLLADAKKKLEAE